ncbi:hypothetical protein GGI1_09973 [Acidithiobacillus sp. GGI-221]|nr:hypothetical protein GGI1_09973 [Acidithiobacillus sp. GGI-221]
MVVAGIIDRTDQIEGAGANAQIGCAAGHRG